MRRIHLGAFLLPPFAKDFFCFGARFRYGSQVIGTEDVADRVGDAERFLLQRAVGR